MRAIFDNSGGVSNAVDYDAFGGIISGVKVDRYSWTGREADSLTGLRHNRAREYDPSIGRWLSEDPIGFTAGDVNLHRYVGNEATGATDPSGNQPPPIKYSPIGSPSRYQMLMGSLRHHPIVPSSPPVQPIPSISADPNVKKNNGYKYRYSNVHGDWLIHDERRNDYRPMNVYEERSLRGAQLADDAINGKFFFPGSGFDETIGVFGLAKNVASPIRPVGKIPSPAVATGKFLPPGNVGPKAADVSNVNGPTTGTPSRGVIRNSRGGVDFSESSDLFPVTGNQKNIVRIEYTGSRRGDSGAANKAAGVGTTQKPPDNYTWHHLDDYDPVTNTGTMQLVRRTAHEATYPHFGGVAQCENATGIKYK